MGDVRPPAETGEAGSDLFDRWLAHREQEQADVTGDVATRPAVDATDPAIESPIFVDTSLELGVAPAALLAVLPATVETPVDPVDAQPAAPAEADAAAASAPESAPGPATETAPEIVAFSPRPGARRSLGLVLLVAVTATAASAYVAWRDGTATNISVAAALALLTAVVATLRSRSAVATLAVREGRLEILRAGSRHQFDLTSGHPPIDVVGEPGSRDWKVLFHRRGLGPYVIDASMVDPVEFTRVVRHYRPASD